MDKGFMDKMLKGQMIGSGISSLGGLFGGLFGGGDGSSPYDAASDQMKQYYQEGQGYLNPFLQALSDPQALQSQWTQGYETSPYAKQMQASAGQYGMDAASSMGLLGSSPALQAIQGGQSNIMAKDRQQYLGDLMQKYLAGAGIAGQMQQGAMGMGQMMGQAAYGAESERQRAGSGIFGSLGNIASMALPFIL